MTPVRISLTRIQKAKRAASLFLPLAILVATSSLCAQQCSTRTTQGRYVVTCDGYLAPGPGPSLVSAKGLATATADEDGNFTGSGTLSVGGRILQQTVYGTEQIKSDCTGTITYKQTIDGQPVPDLQITFVVSKHGNRIDGLATDSGSVFSCVLRRFEAKEREDKD